MNRKLFEAINKVVNEDGIPIGMDNAAEPEQGVELEGGLGGEDGAETSSIPEITPELVEELAAELEVPEEQKADFEKGLNVEIEHYESVGEDMSAVGKIVLDHINEFPAKSYYDALALMETELAKMEEAPAEEAPAEEAPVVKEPPMEAKTEVKAEEGKVPADPGKITDPVGTIQDLSEKDKIKKPAEIGDKDPGKLTPLKK